MGAPTSDSDGIRGSQPRLRMTIPLHPLLVHLPIGLLVTAMVIDIAVLGSPPRATPRQVATGLYLAGAAALVAAYFSGRADAEALRITEMAQGLVDEHWTWALRTTVYVGLLSVTRLGLVWSGCLATRGVWMPVVAAGIVGILLLFQTAERGGRLVYQHGVGVAVPR